MIRDLLDDAAKSGTPDIPLIAGAYKRMRQMDDDTRYNLATDAWVHAAKTFDPAIAKWSTYYYHTADMLRRKYWHQRFRRVHQPPTMVSPWTDDGMDMMATFAAPELPSYNDDRDRIMREVRNLAPRTAAIVIARFGLDGKPSRSMDYIGDKLGISRQRIKQILVEAFDEMRAALA